MVFDDVEKIQSFLIKPEIIGKVDHKYGPMEIYSSEETDRIMESLTLRDMAELVVGGGLSGQRFFEAPGAAGVTTGNLTAKGIPNDVMAAGAVRRLADEINYRTRQNSAYRSGHAEQRSICLRFLFNVSPGYWPCFFSFWKNKKG